MGTYNLNSVVYSNNNVSYCAPKVAFLGDSNTQFGKNSATGANFQSQFTTATYVNYLRWLSRGAFYTDFNLILGVASKETDHWLATQIPQAIAAGVNICISQIGTNDVGNSRVLSTIIANLQAGFQQLSSAGISTIALAITPASAWSTGQRQQAQEINRQMWLMAQNPAYKLRFVDTNTVYTDYSNWNALTNYQFSDNLHDAPLGGYAKAQLVWSALQPILPYKSELLVSSANDTRDATASPAGNMLTNGILTGTTGTFTGSLIFNPSGTATGQVATSWAGGFGASTATTGTIAYSKGTHPDNATIPTQIATLGGTFDGNNLRFGQTLTYAQLTAMGIGVGDNIYLEAEVSWSSLVNVRHIALRLEIPDGTNTPINFDGIAFNPNGTSAMNIPSTMPLVIMRTPVMPLVALNTGGNTLRAVLEAVGASSGSAWGGTITTSRWSVRKAGLGTQAGD